MSVRGILCCLLFVIYIQFSVGFWWYLGEKNIPSDCHDEKKLKLTADQKRECGERKFIRALSDGLSRGIAQCGKEFSKKRWNCHTDKEYPNLFGNIVNKGYNSSTELTAKLRTFDSVLSDLPTEKDWTKEGKVTVVKDQANCGSCWTFGAVGGLETRYALQENAVLRNFAEKEYLDCVYEGKVDGCNGGWMHDCYVYSANNGGRLAKTSDYPYNPFDGICDTSEIFDAMVAAKITGYEKVATTEADNIAAIAEGSITVAFEATKFFQMYKTGILKDMTCTGSSNHAVTAVGYTEKYILVKNSWGAGWGEKGFVRYMRGHHNCGLYQESFYPQLEATGVADSNPDEATDYVAPDNDDRFDPDVCRDKYLKCTKEHCKNVVYAERYCAKTCGKCTDKDGCPSGTIKCSDGVCRHEHMCP